MMNENNKQQYNQRIAQYDEGPWYRQAWAWFILTPLIAVVFMGIGLLITAINTQDSIVVDDYYKEGLAINQRRDAEHLAFKHNIKINLWLDDVTGEIKAEFTGNIKPEILALSFYHPTLKQKDFKVQLQQAREGSFFAHLVTRLEGKWYLSIEEGDNTKVPSELWRLKTELKLPMETPVLVQAVR